MAFGFPAKHMDKLNYNSDLTDNEINEIIKITIQALEFKIIEYKDKIFHVNTGLSNSSFGEKIIIINENNSLNIESKCKGQLFDWGKNKQNVDGFISMFKRCVNELERNQKLDMQKKFLLDNNLMVLPNGHLRDENYEEYELKEESVDFIVYKPEGMRGMRAYIKTDSEKNYLAWSGPIKIADKSKFLRGDFENTEE